MAKALPMNTSEGCLKGAWAAILRGDYAERDRLCDRAKTLVEAERVANAIERVLLVDFYVSTDGRAVSSREMARQAGALQ